MLIHLNVVASVNLGWLESDLDGFYVYLSIPDLHTLSFT